MGQARARQLEVVQAAQVPRRCSYVPVSTWMLRTQLVLQAIKSYRSSKRSSSKFSGSVMMSAVLSVVLTDSTPRRMKTCLSRCRQQGVGRKGSVDGKKKKEVRKGSMANDVRGVPAHKLAVLMWTRVLEGGDIETGSVKSDSWGWSRLQFGKAGWQGRKGLAGGCWGGLYR